MLSRAAVRHSAARPFTSAQSSLRASSFRHLPQIASRTGRRYASTGGHEVKKTSDLPWIAVALVVTIPSTYYLLLPRSAPNSDDHGHGGHEEHSKESHEEKSEDEGKEEKSDEGKDEKSDDDEKSPAKDSDDKGKDTDTGEEKAEKSDTDKKDSADGSDNSKKSEKSEGGAESKGKGDSKK